MFKIFAICSHACVTCVHLCTIVFIIYTIFSQISGVCPRDYPENIDIRVIKYDDQILEDLTRNFSISESAIISLEDSFTLDSNERYISEIFFQNPSEDFNITGAVNFSEQTHVKFTHLVNSCILILLVTFVLSCDFCSFYYSEIKAFVANLLTNLYVLTV